MRRALVIVFLAIALAVPSAAAEETAPTDSPESGDSGAEGAPGPEGEPEPSNPEDGDGEDACGTLENGDMTENSSPVAPDMDGYSGFIGIFVGTPKEEGDGYTGESFGVNTQCVPSVVPDGVCVPEVTCPDD